MLPARLDVDDYVPLCVTFGDGPDHQLYYRYVGGSYLIEIGFDQYKTCLSSIKLVQVCDYVEIEKVKKDFKAIFIEGLPCSDLDQWQGGVFIDSNGSVEIEISEDQLRIRFGSDNDVVSVYRNENVYFGCANDRVVVWILIDEVDVELIKKIKHIILEQQNQSFL
ncbi:hypothetical protein BFW38_10695 [Terasakiispira papahanaumokuakeensis]|uniref:Uncharacterized protein n=2 Tax=Terasakiispira papahanaumokuakeensis TaxID=197479 RepID=A0A1E2VAD1_9GAMM|nr:hypothetical protein BFW38_10695 [Terasakiispira papahanaumokuakeensis]